ncbi:hypothetical protein SAMN05421776_1324 [Nocardia farcinica]|uniref:Protein of uncharacterized function (DUF3705) n=1 Tax=Nocardia farcinica TaxID=37329 RepID=A0A0H5P4M3_NOCFR|nr:hypothetical protein CJ468_06247 [Nocardia farcinica]PFX02156.1 hypothetical protein CJ469_02601 [Nocardia farcinica]CRY82468.1 Protein of uncharacterised function (DUF3705) [Nocardia farcinica]SIT34703.1 hypothetical protein SAMN05421776_1324 [Nocardia farcinica]SUE32263.1 Protein of uncharacterised function (DUF3705) [Nocardia farcinica]
MVSFFVREGDQIVAERLAVSPWAPNRLSGKGVCGLLARDLEPHCPEGFVPARLTVDLYSPVENAAFDICSAIVNASLSQNGQVRFPRFLGGL